MNGNNGLPPPSRVTDKLTASGISAYAHKQASIYHGLVKVFIDDWHKCLTSKSLGSSWIEQYTAPPATKRRRLVSNVRRYHSSPPLFDDTELEEDLDAEDGGPIELVPYDDTSEFTDD